MTKLSVPEFNMLDDETIIRDYTKKEIIECLEDVLETQLTLLMTKADDLGISMGHTGSINPKYFKTHRKLGHSRGLKVWVESNE